MDQKKEKVNKTMLEKMLMRAIPFLGMLYIRFVAFTSRISEHNRARADELINSGKNFIFAFWHSRQFFLGYIRRNDKIKVMISESRDGEYIARVIGYFGMDTVRGSSSRGAARALVNALRALKDGYLIGITPDGPRGPALKAQLGVAALAAKSGCPVIPLSFGSKRKKIMSSWDSYLIPLPFSKIAVTYGEPIFVAEKEDLGKKAAVIEEKMTENTLLSDELSK